MDLSLLLVPSVTLVFALFGGYFGMRLSIRNLWRNIKALEDDINALTERFNRRQNRESMREARAAKEADKDLLEQARAAVAAAGSAVTVQDTDPKKALRAKLQARH